jgi:tetratricopeptide (TPR) repeat protein
MRIALTLALGCALLCPCGARAQATDPEVAQGIAEVENGEYDTAIFTLDKAARRLAEDPAAGETLAQAYLYLGIAYLGKGHEAAAKARFRDAILSMNDLTLDAEQFPPKIIDLFEAAREEARGEAAAEPAAAPTAPPVVAGSESEGGGGSKALLIVGGLAAAGGAAALAAGGGGSGGGATTTTPTRTEPTASAPTTRIFEGQIDDAQYQMDFTGPDFDLFIGAEGELTASLEWSTEGGDRAGALSLFLQNEDYSVFVGDYRQTSETSGLLTALVAPLPGAPTQTYHMDVAVEESCGGCLFTFTLTVQHP